MLLFYINFGDRKPPYPAWDSNIPSAGRPGQWFHFLQCRGSSPSQAWRNRKKGRVGCLLHNIFTRKVTEIAFMAIIIHIPRPPRPCIWRPASPSHKPPRPILDVPNSLVSRPRVTRVPMSPSPCPRPSFIHSLMNEPSEENETSTNRQTRRGEKK